MYILINFKWDLLMENLISLKDSPKQLLVPTEQIDSNIK